MPLHVLSTDVEEEYTDSGSETCSTSRRDISFNSSQSYSTKTGGSYYSEEETDDDDDSNMRAEYTDDKEPTFDNPASPPSKRFLGSSFDNSTLESGSYFLNADDTYRMIDFYRLKNKRERSSEFRSRNPGASWDNSEISDLFSQASHAYEASEMFIGRSTSAVSEALWEAEDEDASHASSAFAPLRPVIEPSDSHSTGGGSAFLSIKTEKTEKASVRELPNNLSMMSSTSQLGSITEHEADTDVDTDVDDDLEVERVALTRNSGWLCWGG